MYPVELKTFSMNLSHKIVINLTIESEKISIDQHPIYNFRSGVCYIAQQTLGKLFRV